MDFHEQIAPFEWVDYSEFGDESDTTVSVILHSSEKYKHSLFTTRKKDGFRSHGDCWESLAQVFLAERFPEFQEIFEFDSESGMFCVRSHDSDALEQFIIAFKEACEDDKLIRDIFSRAVPPKIITADDINQMWKKLLNKDD